MATLELKQIRKTYDDTEVIHGVDLLIESGEFCVFVGPSGCGKSTLLRMIAGLEDITAGDVEIEGEVVELVAQGGNYAQTHAHQGSDPHSDTGDSSPGSTSPSTQESSS